MRRATSIIRLQVLSDETKRKSYDMYGMGSDPFSSDQDTYADEYSRAGTSKSNRADSRGYEQYRSQVDPEELFRKIFGDAFSRGGFGNHEWMNEADPNKIGREGITQVNTNEQLVVDETR
jgi:DnaJ-class molecular chaperone